jgi:NADH:ubiquinone oxidoreductase subunit 6 (subunit J)
MFIKIILVILLALVIFSLFQALFVMLENDDKAPKMSKFLGRRLIFSALVVLLLIVLLITGVITPNPSPY